MLKYCKEHIDPSRLKGFCMAPWAQAIPDEPDKPRISKVLKGVDLFKEARDRHYPSASKPQG